MSHDTQNASDPTDIQTSLLRAESTTNNTDTDTEDTDSRRSTPMDESCHECGTRLSSNTGVIQEGWRVRTGVCPDCRLDGVGSAAFVTVDPDAITEKSQKRLSREQGGNAQSVYSAAVYLDWNAPAGDYAVRRVKPTVLEIDLPDDIDQQRRRLFSEHLRDVAGDTWFVQSFPDVIRLVDKTMGQKSDAQAAATTFRGP